MENNIGEELHGWLSKLFPICRSLTGNGVRETLGFVKCLVPDLKIRSVPSGTKAFDWRVPDEWNIRDAFIMDKNNRRVVDFKEHNLHVVGYSTPVDQELSFQELDKHLHSLPDQPHAIPYVTSYYNKEWGFCLPEVQRAVLRRDPHAIFKVKIDSDLKPGVLNYGELIIPGRTDKEILLSTYVCHPSMANNELSGPCVTAGLARWIQTIPNREFTYRILFLVETIGAIVYLSKHLENMRQNTVAGFVVTCVGDDNNYSFIGSREENTLADKVAKHALKHCVSSYQHYSFLERGSDERQYGSVGVELPVCSICRTKYNEFPEYHTSLDDLSFVTPEGLQGAFEVYQQVIQLLEANKIYRCTVKCEPQLSRRQLYPTLSKKGSHEKVKDMMNLIAYADGATSMLDIADRIGIYMGELVPIAHQLVREGVLETT